MIAAAITRRLNVDPLMRTRLGGASVTGTLTPFPTPLGSQQNSTFAQAQAPAEPSIVSLSLWRTILTVPSQPYTDCAALYRQAYDKWRLLVYNRTHHVDTHCAGRRPTFRFY